MSQVVLTMTNDHQMTVASGAIDAVVAADLIVTETESPLRGARVLIGGVWVNVKESKEWIEDNALSRPPATVNVHNSGGTPSRVSRPASGAPPVGPGAEVVERKCQVVQAHAAGGLTLSKVLGRTEAFAYAAEVSRDYPADGVWVLPR